MTKEEKKAYDKRRYETHKAEILTQKAEYNQTQLGRANRLRNNYIRNDRQAGRIGDTLPDNYVTSQWIIDNIFNSKCAHSGESDWRKLGCNRLDNSKPHTIDNVEPCTKEYNDKLASEDKSKHVAQINRLTGEVIAVYPSIMEAHRDTGVDQSNICQCCKGNLKSVGGYVWQYLN